MAARLCEEAMPHLTPLLWLVKLLAVQKSRFVMVYHEIATAGDELFGLQPVRGNLSGASFHEQVDVGQHIICLIGHAGACWL